MTGALAQGREWYTFGREPVGQVEAADVEAQLGPQHGEVAADVVGGLGGRVGDQVDPPAGEVRQDLAPGVVAGRDREGVGGARPDPQPLLPPSPGVPRGAEHEVDPAVVPVKLGADQHAGAEAQLLEVVADLLEVLVVQLALQRGEQRRQPVGAELLGVVVGDLPQLPEAGHVGFEMADRTGEVGRGVLVRAAVTSPPAPLVLQGADRDGVHLPDDLGLGEAVGQDPLAVADGLRVVEAGEQHLRGHLEQELVTGGHRLQQRGQLQVLDQVFVAGRQVGPEVEVPVLVEEMGLHDASLSRSRS